MNSVQASSTTKERRKNMLHQYEKIFMNISDMIALIDRNYCYQAANEAYLKAFGLRREDLIDREVATVFGEDFFKTVIKENADKSLNGEVTHFEQWVDFPVTGKKFMEVSYLPYRDDADEIIGFIVNARDITDRKRFQEQLERSNQELKKFAYIASHDLQEPLRIVTSYMDLLSHRSAEKLDETSILFIERAKESTGRMKLLIEDLLRVSRVESKEIVIETVDTNHLLYDLIHDMGILIKEKNATIHCDELPVVQADKIQLRQLFQNLINNGLKFQKADNTPKIKITSKKEGAYTTFSVTDNGIGIEEKYYERIFNIFQRLHLRKEYKGTGIGLAICKKIVDRHNGTIVINSEVGKGSCFSFTIPDKN